MIKKIDLAQSQRNATSSSADQIDFITGGKTVLGREKGWFKFKCGCVYGNDPFVNDCVYPNPRHCPDADVNRYGVDVGLFVDLIQAAGMVDLDEMEFVNVSNAGPETIDMINDGRLDATCCFIGTSSILNPDKHTNVKLASGGLKDVTAFIYKKPEAVLMENLLSHYFHYKVMITLLGSFIVLWGLQKIWKKQQRNEENMLRKRRSPWELGLTSFFFVLSIILGVYGNFLSIGLAKEPTGIKPFSDILDLVEKVRSGECKLYRINFDSTILNLKYDLVSLYPDQNFDDLDGMAIDVNGQDGLLAAVGDGFGCRIGVYWRITSTILINGHCRLDLWWDERFVGSIYSIAYNKNFKYGPALDMAMTRGSIHDAYMTRLDALADYRRIYQPKCPTDSSSLGVPNGFRKLKLNQLGQVLIAFACTLALAGVICVVEAVQQLAKRKSTQGNRKTTRDAMNGQWVLVSL